MNARPASLLALIALAGSAACSAPRSVTSYCDTFFTEGQTFRERFLSADAEQDPLGTLGLLLAAPRDLAVFFGKLADVAPDDIRDDVETVRDTFQSQADGVGDKARDISSGPAGLFGTLAGDLATGLASAPAMQRVDTWTTTHCGPPPAG